VIQTAVALTTGDTILPDAVLLEPPDARDDTGVPGGAHVVPGSGPRIARTSAPGEDLRLRTVEERHIRRVLEMTGGNKRRAARLLGLSRSTLDRKLAGEESGPATERTSAIFESGSGANAAPSL
jgi:DNA-binding NtrC family response regulator